jgi:hypothetical protein
VDTKEVHLILPVSDEELFTCPGTIVPIEKA